MTFNSDEIQAYSINRFVRAYGISRSMLYNMWADNAGPRRVVVRGRVLILAEDAKAWLTSLPEHEHDS